MEKILECKTSICSPTFDENGVLHFCSSLTGDINKLENDTIEVVANTKGVPNGIAFDRDSTLYICDFQHQDILMMKQKQAVTEFVRQYEGKIFKGPNSIIFDSSGTMYFTDSGPMGETTIQKPLGSVFAITDEGDEGGTLLQPLAYECLAHPCGLALSPNEDVLYVAETMKNRILRFVQKPMGVYHMSVFHQFSGGFGPTALACDKKYLYVAHFDFAEFSNTGKISILRPDGALHGVIKVEGPEITGLCFDLNKQVLYITECSKKAIYKFNIPE